MKLKDKIALVTGAGRGIGRSIALAFAEKGADVVLAARTRAQLEDVAEEVKRKDRRALVADCDMFSPQAVQQLQQEVERTFGRLDILANNAGISKRTNYGQDHEPQPAAPCFGARGSRGHGRLSGIR